MKTLLTEEQVQEGVARLAREINASYAGRPLTMVGVLTGSIILLADLIRRIEVPLRVGLIQARVFRGHGVKPGPLVVSSDLEPDIHGRHVLLVDDIFDTGHTLFELVNQLDELDPASVHSAVLVRKKNRQEVSLVPEYVGFDIPDEFVVGYGMDFQDKHRNLPYVAVLEVADMTAEAPA
ncbi:MAG: hypoxanthine phosphoribosyltransferase [Pirellulales bacterium]